MKVLLFGATGNLGSRLVPALLVHGHVLTVYVRSPQKLSSLLPSSLMERLSIVEGDAFDSEKIENTLRKYDIDGIVNTAGNHEAIWKEQTLPKLVASITSAAIVVGRERRRPLRAWITGGLGSLLYPGTGYQIQSFMPTSLMAHHHGTEKVMKATPVDELRWSLLCVAWMYPLSERIETLHQPTSHNLVVGINTPPDWQDHWIRWVPIIGPYLNLVPTIKSYSAHLEHVAELIAADLDKENSGYIGQLVGYKDRARSQ